MCRNGGERFAAQYPGLLNSEECNNYIKDSFNKERTLDFLNTKTPCQIKTGHRGGGQFYPPYAITDKSLTRDVETINKKMQKIDVWHYNAYLLVPRLV